MLRIHLFGPPRLLLDESPLPISGRPKVWPLLGYLVLRARSPIQRDLIARTFWPDDHDARARANLRRHLHYVGALLPPPPPTPWIAASASAVAWNGHSPAWCDVIEFERCETTLAGTTQAVALYAGDLLEGYDEPWIEFERESYRVTYVEMRERLVTAALAQRDYAGAEHHARLLLLNDPLRETAVRTLMRIRFEAGDRAGALAAYERFAARLRDEFQTAPMPDTNAAYNALRAGRRPPGSLPPQPLAEKSKTNASQPPKRSWDAETSANSSRR